MWPLIITTAGTLLLREVVKGWNWNRDWSKSDIPDLPSRPGVYIFYNRNDNVNHVGSSGNLRKRISSHEKKYKMKTFDWYPCSTKENAYNLEMKLQEKYGYEGR